MSPFPYPIIDLGSHRVHFTPGVNSLQVALECPGFSTVSANSQEAHQFWADWVCWSPCLATETWGGNVSRYGGGVEEGCRQREGEREVGHLENFLFAKNQY